MFILFVKDRGFMRYLFEKIAVFIFCLCACIIPLSSQANYMPSHLYGNDQIQLAYYQQGVGVYVDKTSIVNEYYNPPYYKLAANIIYYNWNPGHEGVLHNETSHYSYNINDGSVYIDSNMRGSLGPFYNSSNTARQEREMKVAKIIWKSVYHMNWKW